MAQGVVWKLVVDDTGAIKKMELFSKSAEKTDKTMEKTRKSAKSAEHGLKSLGGAFGGLKSMVGMAGGALGVAGLGYGLQSIVSKTSQIAEETDRFSTISGIGAQKSLYYVAALKARGISAEAFSTSLARLSKNMHAAERQQYTYARGQEKAASKGRVFTNLPGEMSEAFQTLHLSTAKLAAMRPEERLEKILLTVSKMKDPLAKARIEMQLFGRGGSQFATVLNMGATGLFHQKQEAERFFPTLKHGTNTLVEMKAAQAESTMAWEGFEFTLGTAVMPAMVKVERAFSSLIGEAEHGKGPLGELVHTFEGIASWAGKAGGFIKGIAQDLGIKLPAGTLGFVLAAAGLHAAKHPIGDTKKAANILKKALTFAGKYEGAAAGAAAGSASTGGAGATATGGAMVAAPLVGYGGLVMLDKAVAHGLKGLVLGSGEGGGSHYGPKELAELAQNKRELIRHSYGGPPTREERATEQYLKWDARQTAREAKMDLHINGTKVGEAISRDAAAMRHIVEGVERAMHGRGARK